MKKLLLIIILSAAPNLYSQDTVNAKFFPMHVGNYYVYRTQGPFFTTYHTTSITHDTIINHHSYFYFDDFNDGDYGGYIRFDSVTGNLLKFNLNNGCSNYPNDEIIDSLPSSVNDIILNCGFYTFKKCLVKTDSTIKFLHDGLIYANVEYKKGLGLFSSCSGEPPPCNYFTELQGAIINGVLWGDTTLSLVEQTGNTIPSSFRLHQNYPNPFNPATNIQFDIPITSKVRVTVHDITGKLMAELIDQSLSPGKYVTSWNADGYASGVYYYRIAAGNFSETKKMILVR